jgi:glyoxylase-like metal-dependent hydrolase (beta-lactamase superfamily II)
MRLEGLCSLSSLMAFIPYRHTVSSLIHMHHPSSELENGWFSVEILDETTFGIGEYGQWMKVHSYLFLGEKKAVLVDTGLGVGNIRTIVESITDLPVHVITTHAHWDHTGGNHLFESYSAHELEKDWIEQSGDRDRKEIADWLIKDPFTKEPPPEFDRDQFRPFNGKVELLHKDGDVFDLGGRHLEIIHTPGHSIGHVSVYEEASGYLCTADLLYQGVLLAGLTYSNPNDYHNSLKRLKVLPNIKKLLPGHGRQDIDNELLDEAIEGFDDLENKGLLKLGSGLHKYKRLKISLGTSTR